jgi:uncharacterized RDD family membrane protein YckC
VETKNKLPYCKKCGAQLAEEAAFCQECGTPVRAPVAPVTPSVPTFRSADWGERFVAWLIDIIIISIFLAPTKFFFAIVAWPSITFMPASLRWIPFADFGLDNAICFFYWMLMEGMYGQSIGKMALNLKVTMMNNKPVDLGSAAVESIGKAFLLPIDCLVGWIFYSGKNQRLFNYVSYTKVVKLR